MHWTKIHGVEHWKESWEPKVFFRGKYLTLWPCILGQTLSVDCLSVCTISAKFLRTKARITFDTYFSTFRWATAEWTSQTRTKCGPKIHRQCVHQLNLKPKRTQLCSEEYVFRKDACNINIHNSHNETARRNECQFCSLYHDKGITIGVHVCFAGDFFVWGPDTWLVLTRECLFHRKDNENWDIADSTTTSYGSNRENVTTKNWRHVRGVTWVDNTNVPIGWRNLSDFYVITWDWLFCKDRQATSTTSVRKYVIEGDYVNPTRTWRWRYVGIILWWLREIDVTWSGETSLTSRRTW